MGKFSPKAPKVSAATAAVPTVALTEKDTTEEDKAADRLRLAEKKRKGRRASILSNIDLEEIQSASISRPGGHAPATVFGG